MSNRRKVTAVAVVVAGLVAGLAGTGGLLSAALAASLPAVKLSPGNEPPACVTPGRLMAFIRDRNPRLMPKFETIAADYETHGRDLGVRWDYAFYQMVVETNSLKFTGDVRPTQNNFAGLGATGGGVKGEQFRSVSDGVRAHLQHLMIYAGIYVSDPVADRTRKVQSWRILDRWRSTIRGPVTYGDVGTKWAPVDRGYAQDIETIANAFHAGHCNRPDPNPGLAARPSYDTDKRAALGAAATIEPPAGHRSAGNDPATNYRTLNGSSASPAAAASQEQRTAAIAKFASPSIQPPPAAKKCRVWTASYGGQKATIIRSAANGTTNFTVLDVNAGREAAETKAYIAAYAKGGSRIGDFPNKSDAMAKAFELCPEG